MNESSSFLDRRVKKKAVIFLLFATVILWIPVTGLLLGNPPGFLRNLGFISGPKSTPLAWILAIVFAIVFSLFAIRNIPLVRSHWKVFSAVKILGILAAVGAALVEEAIFRRVLMDWMMGLGNGVFIQILASGIIFGLAHGIWGIVTGKIVAGVGATIATGIIGIAFAIVYVLGERSLAPVIVSHFIIDAVIQPGIMFAAFSGQMPKPKKGWWRITGKST